MAENHFALDYSVSKEHINKDYQPDYKPAKNFFQCAEAEYFAELGFRLITLFFHIIAVIIEIFCQYFRLLLSVYAHYTIESCVFQYLCADIL